MAIGPGTYGGQKLDAGQAQVAQTIYNVGKGLGASDRDIQIAFTAARVESNFRNLNYGDRDSLGVFQQRAPWGSVAQRTNVAESTRMFFEGGHGGQPGLFDKPNRHNMTIGMAAQSVQVSAFPAKYDMYVAMSEDLIKAAGGVPGAWDSSGIHVTPAGIPGLDQLKDAISFITNPGNWLRVGLFVVGLGMLVMASLKAMGKSEVVQDAVKTGVQAVALKGKG